MRACGAFMDFTWAYVLRQFVLKRAPPGEYTIKAKYFGSHQQVCSDSLWPLRCGLQLRRVLQSLTGATTLLISVFKFYGHPHRDLVCRFAPSVCGALIESVLVQEQRQLLTVRLTSNKEMMTVAKVTFSPSELAAARSSRTKAPVNPATRQRRDPEQDVDMETNDPVVIIGDHDDNVRLDACGARSLRYNTPCAVCCRWMPPSSASRPCVRTGSSLGSAGTATGATSLTAPCTRARARPRANHAGNSSDAIHDAPSTRAFAATIATNLCLVHGRNLASVCVLHSGALVPGWGSGLSAWNVLMWTSAKAVLPWTTSQCKIATVTSIRPHTYCCGCPTHG